MLVFYQNSREEIVKQISEELRVDEIEVVRFQDRIKYILSLIPDKKYIKYTTSCSEEDGYEENKDKLINVPFKTLFDKFIIIAKSGHVDTIEIYSIEGNIYIEHLDTWNREGYWYFEK